MTEVVDQPKAIDWELCLTKVNNNPDLAKLALAAFITDLKENLIGVRQSAQSQDLASMREFIHKLHGGSYYFGVPQLSKCLCELNNKLRTASADQLQELIYPVEVEAERIFLAYEEL